MSGREPKVVVSASWGPVLRKFGARLVEANDRITLDGPDGWAFRAVVKMQSVFHGTQPDSLLTDDGLMALAWERARHSTSMLAAVEKVAKEFDEDAENRTGRARQKLAQLGLWPRTLAEVRSALRIPDEDRPVQDEDATEVRFGLLELD